MTGWLPQDDKGSLNEVGISTNMHNNQSHHQLGVEKSIICTAGPRLAIYLDTKDGVLIS